MKHFYDKERLIIFLPNKCKILKKNYLFEIQKSIKVIFIILNRQYNMRYTTRADLVLLYFKYIVNVPYPCYDSRELKLLKKRKEMGWQIF